VPGVDEAHEGLVDERSSLQRVAGMLPPHVAVGEAPKLTIDERRQAIQGA
jgi:hypothetical protein